MTNPVKIAIIIITLIVLIEPCLSIQLAINPGIMLPIDANPYCSKNSRLKEESNGVFEIILKLK